MKHINVLFLFLFIAISCEAQNINKIRLLITDSQNGKVTSLDTIVSANSDMNEVLAKLGYDQYSIAEMQSNNHNRRITICLLYTSDAADE